MKMLALRFSILLLALLTASSVQLARTQQELQALQQAAVQRPTVSRRVLPWLLHLQLHC